MAAEKGWSEACSERGKGGCRAGAGNAPGVSREATAASWTRTTGALVLLFVRAGKGEEMLAEAVRWDCSLAGLRWGSVLIILASPHPEAPVLEGLCKAIPMMPARYHEVFKGRAPLCHCRGCGGSLLNMGRGEHHPMALVLENKTYPQLLLGHCQVLTTLCCCIVDAVVLYCCHRMQLVSELSVRTLRMLIFSLRMMQSWLLSWSKVYVKWALSSHFTLPDVNKTNAEEVISAL